MKVKNIFANPNQNLDIDLKYGSKVLVPSKYFLTTVDKTTSISTLKEMEQLTEDEYAVAYIARDLTQGYNYISVVFANNKIGSVPITEMIFEVPS